jgi:hypothetical protein
LYFFDRNLDKIYVAPPKRSKKVSNLGVTTIVSYCIDDLIQLTKELGEKEK